MKESPQLSESLVPFSRVAKFIRQLTHDVRNGLSAVDLEAAFIAELVTDPEVVDELRKLRGMVANTAKMLRDVSQSFQPVTVHVLPWKMATLFEELQTRLEKQFPDEIQSLQTQSDLHSEMINVDLEQIISAISEVLKNTFQLRKEGVPVKLSAFAESNCVVIEIREPKPAFDSQVPPEEWGIEPLLTARPGGYGLGLFRARQILEAHSGELEVHYLDEVLVTRMVLPVWLGVP